ncbi:MAE_28990/MAE_18760 family HEPN-like nuclease [Xanthomonas campestris]|uniref:MAE_28990/MAE_18760 family HEPN-like nuclease n=1 Tax=Xanthomonas campestris TaxID=339 RepID=UPI001E5C8A76|nr:MAE_28990/MAE_18760 family HEPN-like nuclease [Xanthomonas campestris]
MAGGGRSILQNIENFSHLHLIKAPVFPEVDTKSNLWPNVLIDLMNSADLRSDKVEENRSKLHTLVARRNKIAHGENSVIPEFSYYKSYEDAVYDVIYDLAYQIADRLQTAPYMRSI